MLTGEGNENCEIQTIGLIAARSFVHFLAVDLYDYMKLTSRNFVVFTFSPNERKSYSWAN